MDDNETQLRQFALNAALATPNVPDHVQLLAVANAYLDFLKGDDKPQASPLRQAA